MNPMVIIGLGRLLKSVSPERDNASFIDAAVVGIAMFGSIWVLFLDKAVHGPTVSKAAFVTQLLYPMMDVALLVAAARLLVKLKMRHPPFALISVAVGSLAIA